MIFGGHAENYPGTASHILCSNCVYLSLQTVLMLNACQLNKTQCLLVQADSEVVREKFFYHKSAVKRTVLLNLETVTFASSSCPKTTSDSLCMICVTVL